MESRVLSKKEYNKAYYARTHTNVRKECVTKDEERMKAYRREYYVKNRERILETQRKYRTTSASSRSTPSPTATEEPSTTP